MQEGAADAGWAPAQDALRAGRFEDVAELLDEAELAVSAPELPAGWPAGLHLLSHIYNLDLVDARLLWRRLPGRLKQGGEAEACFALLQALWNKRYTEVWPPLAAEAWDESLQLLLTALRHKLLTRHRELIERAYTSVPLDCAAALLGLPQAETLDYLEQQGWEGVRTQGALLRVPARKAAKEDFPSEEELVRLSQYVLQMETVEAV